MDQVYDVSVQVGVFLLIIIALKYFLNKYLVSFLKRREPLRKGREARLQGEVLSLLLHLGGLSPSGLRELVGNHHQTEVDHEKCANLLRQLNPASVRKLYYDENNEVDKVVERVDILYQVHHICPAFQ